MYQTFWWTKQKTSFGCADFVLCDKPFVLIRSKRKNYEVCKSLLFNFTKSGSMTNKTDYLTKPVHDDAGDAGTASLLRIFKTSSHT